MQIQLQQWSHFNPPTTDKILDQASPALYLCVEGRRCTGALTVTVKTWLVRWLPPPEVTWRVADQYCAFAGLWGDSQQPENIKGPQQLPYCHQPTNQPTNALQTLALKPPSTLPEPSHHHYYTRCMAPNQYAGKWVVTEWCLWPPHLVLKTNSLQTYFRRIPPPNVKQNHCYPMNVHGGNG